MNKRGSFGLSMADRVAFNRKLEDCPVRHCWVLSPAGAQQRVPGLLAEWRHTDDEWLAQVVYAAQPNPSRWSLVEEWLPADRVQPADVQTSV